MQVVLTGISQGLGLALYNILKNQKINLVALSRRFLEEQYADENNIKNLTLLKVDLSNIEELKKVMNSIEFEKNILFINNASKINPINKISDISAEEIVNAIDLNFIAPALILNAATKAQPKILSVINITTGADKRAIDNWSLYCSTKAALRMFLDVLNLENNIQVIHIDPGVMDTNMQALIRKSNFKDLNYFEQLKSDGKLKSPEEVACYIFESFIKERLI